VSGSDGLTESQRIEREEFARGHIDPGDQPAEPRPAATMVLARESRDGGLELLLLRRPEISRFAAGAYVFPGGVIDPEDRRAEIGDRLGPEAPERERAALVAALREGFEETGLLPADGEPDPGALREARAAILRGKMEFGEVVRELDLRFHGMEAAYFARWVTPARLSRRYDARFFLVRHRGGSPRLSPVEHTGSLWLAPGEALRRFESGTLPLLYPTRKTVEELSGFGSLAGAMDAFRRRSVEAMRPRLRVEGDSVIPVLPGDDGYEEAALPGPEGAR
jgi:8-oxo-dGTP pyrophosphatase MutT (NUDIX family)